jgi:phage/plasmid-like protein (TIGR03299 family)
MPAQVDSMFSYNEVPWHGEGKILDHPASAAEAIKEAGLNWEVELRPVTVAGITMKDKYATVRTDTGAPLGIVGSRYRPFQNVSLFSFFDAVVKESEAIYHTGGSLRGGSVVWLLAKLNSSFFVIKDDRVDGYVLLASSHDGRMMITAKLTPIRVVCNNTLAAAMLGAGTSVSIKHTASAEYEMKLAHNVLGIATSRMESIKGLAMNLLSIRVSATGLKKTVNHLFHTTKDDEKNRHLAPIELLYSESQGILPYMRGTGWAAYNAITEYIDHVMPAKKSSPGSLYRSWFGTGESIRERALDFLIKEAGDL